MEPFKINITEPLTVHPQANGSFDVFRGETKLANLTPLVDGETGAVTWTSSDLIASDYVQHIGSLIEQKE